MRGVDAYSNTMVERFYPSDSMGLEGARGGGSIYPLILLTQRGAIDTLTIKGQRYRAPVTCNHRGRQWLILSKKH